MTLQSLRKGATVSVAPFALALLLICPPPVNAGSTACPAAHTDERVRVVYVYDGDTVRLADGRRVRLIGINAPETAHGNHAPQPFAGPAHAALQALLDANNRTLLLQHGVQREDHYGRLLAHAWLEDGTNVAVQLLAKGLATALVVPPNTRQAECYARVEATARIDRTGLWGHPRYRSRSSDSLSGNERGFHIVHGRVAAVQRNGGGLRIRLDGPLTLHIGRDDLANFPRGLPERLVGRTVEVRGWVRSRASQLHMTVRHPAALVVLEQVSP